VGQAAGAGAAATPPPAGAGAAGLAVLLFDAQDALMPISIVVMATRRRYPINASVESFATLSGCRYCCGT